MSFLPVNQVNLRYIGADRLNTLKDVRMNDPQDGQGIIYDASTLTWVNGTIIGGGGGTGNVSSTPTETTKLVPNVDFSGEAAAAELTGGLEMPKNFAGEDGTTYLANNPPGAYSQAIYFGDKSVEGSWRVAAVQKGNTPTSTILAFERLQGGVWTTVSTIT